MRFVGLHPVVPLQLDHHQEKLLYIWHYLLLIKISCIFLSCCTIVRGHLQRYFRDWRTTSTHANLFQKYENTLGSQTLFALPETFAKPFHYYLAPTPASWPMSRLLFPHVNMCISCPHYMVPLNAEVRLLLQLLDLFNL